jgi:hypothetical protein
MSAPFEQLERELVAAAARLAAGEAAPATAVPPASRGRGDVDPFRRLRISAAGLAVVLLALAAAAGWLAAEREARRPGAQRTAPAWPLAVGESRIASVRAPAAGAQPDWAVRVSRPKPAIVCITVGQVRARKLGLAGYDGRFRELPADTADACGAEAALAARPVQSGGRVVGGVAGDGLRSVRIEEGGALVLVPHSPEGAFVHVTNSPRAKPVVSLRWSDGRAERLVVPSSKSVIPVPDPSRTAPATRDPSAPPPLSSVPALPAPRPLEPSQSPGEPVPHERRDGSI